jgi:hypothetical protein
MLFRLLVVCLLALLFTSSAGAVTSAAPAQQQLEVATEPGAPQPESQRCWLAAEPASLAEAGAEPCGPTSGLAPTLSTPGMEAPQACAPQRPDTPALAGIERPPRAASGRA